MKAADVRKFLAAALAAVATIGGEVLNASLAHGDSAKWVSLGIAAVGTVSASIGVYALPNGQTLHQRVAALELPVNKTQVWVNPAPVVSASVGAASAAPVVDPHAGLSGAAGVWPAIPAPDPSTPAGPVSP